MTLEHCAGNPVYDEGGLDHAVCKGSSVFAESFEYDKSGSYKGPWIWLAWPGSPEIIPPDFCQPIWKAMPDESPAAIAEDRPKYFDDRVMLKEKEAM